MSDGPLLFESSPFASFRHELREDDEMHRSTDRRTDVMATTVSLAAEAALLEGRLSLLREAIDTVDARIDAVSESLRRLQRPAPRPAGGGAGGNGPDRSTPSRP
ncbi:hypothetical protein [Streptomyces sp. NPDC059639]|uniref:hypothetical protein n=1 Tax=Streptomyces sp. NPDC059639 TaxID=3346891 RepID=UPI00369543A7